jgi:hypothetical protein
LYPRLRFVRASDETPRRLKPLIDRRSFGTAKAVPFHNLEISIVVAPDGRVNRIVDGYPALTCRAILWRSHSTRFADAQLRSGQALRSLNFQKACRFERSEKSAVGQESGFLTAKAVRNDKGDGGRLVEW